MSSYEVSRFMQKCQKERDDALRREESARDKLKILEASTRSQIQEIKAKLKEVTGENKTLQKTVKRLRLELGLEDNPRFKGKMTRDIIKELHEREAQCSHLKEESHMLSVQLREIVPVVDQAQKQKWELQARLQSLENKVSELKKENDQVLLSLQESQREKEDLEKTNLMLRKSIEEARIVTNRSVQTTTSIPVNLQNIYKSGKKLSRDTSISQAS
ncbi:uncharacterized protein RCH25_006373 [Pelodytes ibericus]